MCGKEVRVKVTLKYKLGHDLVILFPDSIETAVKRIDQLCAQGIDYEVKYEVIE